MKLLSGIIISCLIGCTTPITTEHQEQEVKATYTKKKVATHKLDRSFYQENLSGEDLRGLVQWYTKLPDSIQFGHPSIHLKVYLSEKVEFARDTEAAMTYVNDLEKKIHMKVGFSNSIPQAVITTSYESAVSDSCYVIISVEL